MAPRWNKNLKTMPKSGRFVALRQNILEVYHHLPDEDWVIEPSKGLMFKPVAWRPVTRKRAKSK